MNTWISLLPLDLDNITPEQIIEPTDELSPGDEEIGIMPETSRKLFTFGRMMERDSGLRQLDARLTNDQNTRAGLLSKAFELGTKCNLIRDLMWIDIRDELHLWHYTDIGIRRGFKVVHSKSNPVLRMFGFGGELP